MIVKANRVGVKDCIDIRTVQDERAEPYRATRPPALLPKFHSNRRAQAPTCKQLNWRLALECR